MEAAVAFPTVPFANAGSKFEKVYNSVVNRLKESSNLATHYSVDYSVYDDHYCVIVDSMHTPLLLYNRKGEVHEDLQCHVRHNRQL